MPTVFIAIASIGFSLISYSDTPPVTTTPDHVQVHSGLQDLVERYAAAVNDRDRQGVDACFDIDAFLDRVTHELRLSRTDLASFRAGARQSFSWGAPVVQGLGETGHYRFLRFQSDDTGAPTALFRLINDEGGLNYHDLDFVQRADGTWRIADGFVFITGEKLSESMRRVAQDMLASGPVAKVDRAAQTIEEMTRHLQAGEFARAYSMYEGLPKELKSNRTLQTFRVIAAAQVNEIALQTACDDFRATFPNDPSVDLLMLDQLVMSGQWEESIRALDRMRSAIGGDPFLDYLAANAFYMWGKPEAAIKILKHTIRSEPTLEEAHWSLIEIALGENQFDAVASALAGLEAIGWTFDGLEDAPEYRGFVASDAYQGWRTPSSSAATDH